MENDGQVLGPCRVACPVGRFGQRHSGAGQEVVGS